MICPYCEIGLIKCIQPEAQTSIESSAFECGNCDTCWATITDLLNLRHLRPHESALLDKLLHQEASLGSRDVWFEKAEERRFIHLELFAQLREENTEHVKRLIRKEDGDVTDEYYRTALHIAAQKNMYVIVEMILTHQHVSINATDDYGYTPLHYAMWHDNTALYDLLLKHGADLNALTHNGDTPLMTKTYQWGDYQQSSVKYLLKKGAEVSHVNKDGQTAYSYSVMRNRYDIASLLEGHGAAIFLQNIFGITPLHYATRHNSLDLAYFHIQREHPAQVVNNAGNTPLYNTLLVKELVRIGLDVNHRNKDGQTPLHYAARWNASNTQYLEILIANGAIVNATDYYGYTPLHLAVLNSYYPDSTRLLLQHGADKFARDVWGRMPLDLLLQHCTDTGRREMFISLLSW